MLESDINQLNENLPLSAPNGTSRRIAIPIALLLFGAVVGLTSLVLVSNQFGNTDSIGLILFGLASCVFVTGVAHFFLRLPYATIIGVVAAPISVVFLFVLFWVALFATAFQNRDHQGFAVNGVNQVQTATQMEELYDDCRHYVTYNKDGPLFNSVAYFGDRYELTMQVPIEIHSKTSGSITGQPKFYLNEISSINVSPSGQVGASISRNFDFGSSDWKQVYKANGDFGKIGFGIKPTGVPNFQKYVDASRPSG